MIFLRGQERGKSQTLKREHRLSYHKLLIASDEFWNKIYNFLKNIKKH